MLEFVVQASVTLLLISFPIFLPPTMNSEAFKFRQNRGGRIVVKIWEIIEEGHLFRLVRESCNS